MKSLLPDSQLPFFFTLFSIDIHEVSRMRAVVAGYKAALSNTPTINSAKPLSVDIHNVSRIQETVAVYQAAFLIIRVLTGRKPASFESSKFGSVKPFER